MVRTSGSRHTGLAALPHRNNQTADWRDTLGDEKENPYVRKRIGDFACYLILIDSIHAR